MAGAVYLNGHIDPAGQHHVSGFTAAGREQFRLPLPDKAHGFAVNPLQPWQIVATPTLPGTRALVFDARTGLALRVAHSAPGRHFNGHGCFSQDGRLFFSSENIAASAAGVIGVRDATDFRLLRELPAHGIGPHDLRLLPDGKTLAVAGGGIRTHPDSGKRELNINTLHSALLYIDTENGELLEQQVIQTPRLSFRHLDVTPQGEVVLACQYKGKREVPPLVAVHRRGEKKLQWLTVDDEHLWQMNQYTASVRVAANGVAAVSCPRGNCLTLWDLPTRRWLATLEIADVGGIEVVAQGNDSSHDFIVSANVGELYRIDTRTLTTHRLQAHWPQAKWTNHMTRFVS